MKPNGPTRIAIVMFGWLFLAAFMANARSSLVAASGNEPGASGSNHGEMIEIRQRIGVKVTRAAYQQSVREIPAGKNHVWRNTPEGWRQIPIGPQPFVHRLDLKLETPRVHPFSVAALTLLLALAAMAWTSSEWDWERFVGAKK